VLSVLRFMAHQSVRLSVAAVLVIIAGLAILAHEFAWAAAALDKAKARAAQAKEAAMRRTARRAQGNQARGMDVDYTAD
jgi:hypothetical protein